MIAIIFGTRPEYIKFKSIINCFIKNNIPYKCYYVKQHSESFLGLNNLDYETIEIDSACGNRLQDIIISISKNLKFSEDVKYAMVQGDTATAFAASLVAFNNKIKILHVEAGLRTYDFENPFPEEGYRQLIDKISYARFCPTERDFNNLIKENLTERNFVVGNTSIDELPNITPSKLNEVYITLHRRENHGIMLSWLEKLEKLATKYESTHFYLIKHLNPDVVKHYNFLKKVKLIDPLPHHDLINIIAKRCLLMISDSGGIQEECSHYNKTVLVCRKHTERPYPGAIIVNTPENLIQSYEQHINNNLNTRGWFGDGTSGEKITKIVKEFLL